MLQPYKEYYSLPLQLDKLVRKENADTCSLRSSIAQNIFLLITTELKEFRHNHSYGSVIWEDDFEILSYLRWKDQIRKSLEETLLQHEKRLINFKLHIDIQEYLLSEKRLVRIKRRLEIKIQGFIAKTNEPFEFIENIFVSPFSLN